MAVASAPPDQMAELVRIVGRGPGRSRHLSRDEAAEAFRLMMCGVADPYQTGAMLMLLRYRGESPVELAGFVDAARQALAKSAPEVGQDGLRPDLDWPSYSGGRTRGGPWFLLSALALAQAGYKILMHGSHEFSTSLSPANALSTFGLRPARDMTVARQQIAESGFAYLPLQHLSPPISELLNLRRLFGLRSPVNTVVRLLNPGDATASIDGVFHPPYINAHLETAALLNRERLLVMKGAGGEAERNPAKECVASLWSRTAAQSDKASTQWQEFTFPPRTGRSEEVGVVGAPALIEVWRRGVTDWSGPIGIIIGTIALALLAMGTVAEVGAAETMAEEIWKGRAAQ